MSLSRAAAFAVLALASTGGNGSAAEPPAADAAPGGRNTVQVGPATGDAERDSAGFTRGDGDGRALVPLV